LRDNHQRDATALARNLHKLTLVPSHVALHTCCLCPGMELVPNAHSTRMGSTGAFMVRLSLPVDLTPKAVMKIFLSIVLLTIAAYSAFAQIDTTSYPNERREIREILRHQKPGVPVDCSDFIAVGPKGDISFSHQQWVEVQKKEKVVFKSVHPVPGNEFIRIYDASTAVVNFLLDVSLVVDGQDIRIKVRRLEVYHKGVNGWCRVAGQGTQVDEKLFPVNTK